MSAATVVGAVWQSAAVTGDIDANTATVRAAIERAAAEGAHIIVFPELFLTNYNDGSSTEEVQGTALSLDGEVMASIAAMAGVHSIAVAVGYAEKAERGADEGEVRVYNSCALWDCHGHLVKVRFHTVPPCETVQPACVSLMPSLTPIMTNSLSAICAEPSMLCV